VNFGLAGAKAVDVLVESTRHSDASIRGDSAAALGMLAGMERAIDPEKIPKIVTALATQVGPQEQQRSVRLQATLALAQLGPRGKGAVPAVAQLLNDTQSWEVRKSACYCLGRIGSDARNGPDSAALLTLVRNGLTDSCSPVRLESIMALSALGLSPRPDEVNLEKRTLEPLMLRDPDKSIQIWARVLTLFLDPALLANPINTDKALQPIRQAVAADPDPKVRSTAVRALGILGPKAGPNFLSNIMPGLRDRELEVILTTIGTLAQLGDNAKGALPDIGNCLDDPEPSVRAAAVRALALLGDMGRSLWPRVREKLTDKDDNVIQAAIGTLAVLGPMAEFALPDLLKIAESHKNDTLRLSAKEAAKLIAQRSKK